MSFSGEWTAIRDLETRIRDFVTEARRRQQLVARSADWNMLTSSLDVIGDTELAIEAYLSSPEARDHGGQYLLIYGILQVLFVQQDALQHIAAALRFPYKPYPELFDIRDIRNKTVGHPTKKDRPGAAPQSSHHISRPSINRTYFQLLSTYEDGRVEFTAVNLRELIVKQRHIVRNVLSQVVNSLQEDEMAHREKFKDQRLADIFSTTGYFLGKVLMASHQDSTVELCEAKSSLKCVCEHIGQFKKSLEERGVLPAYDSISHVLGELNYPLQQLESIF
ncbi:MAG TPA: hypothetical protein VMX16_10030 [Terriglobia bacterium]|nr:hypothetical protein [Terriglobia bacterium]